MISTYAITHKVEQVTDKDGTVKNNKRWSNTHTYSSGTGHTHKVINGVSFTISTFPGSKAYLHLNYNGANTVIAIADTVQELKDYASTIGNHIEAINEGV